VLLLNAGPKTYRCSTERTGMVKSTIYHACSGDRVGDLDTWMKMADAFALPVSVLIGDCDGRQQ
jgi:hypothetical protein